MPFPMRIQPIDSIRSDAAKPPVAKSRLKRLFDRPFNGVIRISSADKPAVGGEKDGGAATEFEPGSVYLDKMVRNFIEGNDDKQFARNRCNCFNGNSNDSSDDELDFFSDSVSANSSFGDPSDTLKSLMQCQSTTESNLLADISRIIEKSNKTCKRKDDLREIVNHGLLALGYNASICKSKWDKTASIPAGNYEYIDVIIKDERMLIDIDFRSEFEIARSTHSYRAVLQCLPYIFVGKIDRLLQVVSIVAEAARVSLKKKGMHVAPWRKSEYVKSKWLGPHTRIKPQQQFDEETRPETKPESREVSDSEVGELDSIFSERDDAGSPEKENSTAMTWQLPAVRLTSSERGKKTVVTGLASLLKGEIK